MKELTTRKTPANRTSPKVAVQRLNQALCFYQSLGLVDTFFDRNRYFRVAEFRWATYLGKIILNGIVIFLITSCNLQSNRFENSILECAYKSYSDNGLNFKNLISDYQDLLIKDSVLDNKNPNGYKKLLKHIVETNHLKKIPSKFFVEELSKIKGQDIEKLIGCSEKLMGDSTLYNLSRFKNLNEQLNNLTSNSNAQPSDVARVYLNFLTNDNYKNDFYKLRIFLLLESYNQVDIIKRELPLDKNGDNIKNEFYIHLDSLDNSFLNHKLIKNEKLKFEIRKYILENKESAEFRITTEKNTDIRRYIEIYNLINSEIENERSAYAKKQFNKEINTLTKDEIIIINQMYPMNIK